MSYEVPYSSSPPETPERGSGGSKNIFAMSNPSTTPAGPPPSSANSFTPSGPPPSSYLGSSINPLSFTQKSNYEPPQPNFDSPGSSLFADSMRSNAPRRTAYDNNSPQRGYNASLQESEYEDYEDDEDMTEYNEEEDDTFHQSRRSRNARSAREADAMGEDDPDAQYEDDEDIDYPEELPTSKANNRAYGQRSISEYSVANPGTLKRSIEGGALDFGGSVGGKQEVTTFGKIARDIYSQIRIPEVDESDDVVLGTEAIVTRIYQEGLEDGGDPEQLQSSLMEACGDLTILWDEYDAKSGSHGDQEYTAAIGPGDRALRFSKANFLAGLALKLHHPTPISTPRGNKAKPMPEVLIEWMDLCHNPVGSQLEDLQSSKLRSPSAHPEFWNILFNNFLRGNVREVCELLARSKWEYANVELDDHQDSYGQSGYSGQALANVKKAVGATIDVLSQCPGLSGDWNTQGSDWTLFRLKVSQAMDDLKAFAEGKNKEGLNEDRGFGRSSTANPNSYSRIAERAASQVPWHIFQHLVILFNIAMGDRVAIVENAQDWCEGTVALTVWWDETKDDRRIALGRSTRALQVPSKEMEIESYFRKLRKSFQLAVGANVDFEVDTLRPIEVGLASIFEGDYEAVLGLLRAWSGPISSAVAEIATIGGWLPEPEQPGLMESLDQDDMDLLGISAPGKPDGIKDQTLIAYGRGVAFRGELQSSKTLGQQPISREGWEVAIAVLGRLDSASRSENMVGEFLKDFPLKSPNTVNKLWVLLNNIGMGSHAESSAAAYADSLAEGSHNYGEAMWYYALSHKSDKVKDVLDLLISFSLVQSTAYPPEADLDEYLKSLISYPKTSLVELSQMDYDAAELLRNSLSGYATLRKFYDLRDEEVLFTKAKKPRMGAVARKQEAARALMAVITSSGDNIRGGLYDEQNGAIVSVDFLLALLGEAMVFVNQPTPTITVSQIEILLRAIEDLQTVGSRVYTACTEFLQTVIASGQGMKGSSPHDMLRKSTSAASGTSSFSMVGSSMLAIQMKMSMGSSGVLVKGGVKRGWDWRRGISATTTGEEVLQILRLGLARDLARAWLREADGEM
ncbi:hypothetical protein HYALB_00010508 [Hymenoscyphus albidus]|uniref:Nuclear pore complex protein Nup85 n=1 Tax=Hymenoscyphus albidus TaxID=595503 RepID=A0A9N9M2P0_9HELO|nr:hypothetical protein HYALB_00010508 [Hymenoscyphus albidus]